MSTEDTTANCVDRELTIVLRDDAVEAASIEDDIRKNLEKIGIKLNTDFVDADGYTAAERDGTYNILFTKSWGAPYDPHSYLQSWETPGHVENSAIGGLQPNGTREILLEKIGNALSLSLGERELIQQGYKEILNDIHQQIFILPLYGVRTPYVINRRLTGFVPPPQTYSYPINNLNVLAGSTGNKDVVTVAPGTGGALFKSTGEIHAHLYSPNELFAQDWVYEGLLKVGADGQPNPGLAVSWNVDENGQRVTFDLRQNVKFHDGEEFNCSAVKLNFDHVLSDNVRTRHSWFGAAQHISQWSCDSSGRFVLETSKMYYPLLQELTYIRPLVIASPASFVEGLESDPDLHNSCSPGGFGQKYESIEDNVNCAGLKNPIGTGPFKFVSRTPLAGAEGIDENVRFEKNAEYWGDQPSFRFVDVKYYETTDKVYEALIDGSLDMALGVGPLSASQVRDLEYNHTDKLEVRRSQVLQNALLVMNTGKAPTDDIEVRKAITHAIDKDAFIEKEFAGLEQPVFQLMPRAAPFCNIDLSPKWGYDVEKAKLINCPESKKLSAGEISGIGIGVAVIVVLIAAISYIIFREKKGKPVFNTTNEETVGFSP